MQMRPGNPTGRANSAQNISSCDLLTFCNRYLTHVAVHRNEALPVIDKHCIAVEKVVARCCDRSGAWRDNRLTIASRNIHSLVR